MFEIESDDFEDASCDPHQNLSNQGTIASNSPVRKTLAKTYTDSTRVRGKRGEGRYTKDATTLPADRNMTYPLSPTIVQTGHSAVVTVRPLPLSMPTAS